MEMEMKDDLGMTMDRLAAAASLLEQVAERLAERQSAFGADAEATIGRIVATVEARRETELEAKLAAAERRIAELQAQVSEAAGHTSRSDMGSRKTLPSAMAMLLAKQGVTPDSFETASLEAGAVDAALSSLSLEQRIAVKAQLMRAGLLG